MLNEFEDQVKAADGQSRISIENVYDADRMIQEYQDYIKNLQKINFKTGIGPIDEKIRGVAGGEVLTIIARAGCFKTAALQNLLLSYTKNSAWGGAFFSLEMPVPSVAERYHEIISGFSGYEVENAYRQNETYLLKIQKDFRENLSKLFVIPVKVSLKDIPEYIALIESHHGLKMGVIGIDYLGLLDARGPNEYEIVSRLARDVKTMAKEINLPVVLLTQTSRKAGSGDTEITVDMGRGSGAIEEAADFVLGLFQDERQVDNGEPEYDLICKILKNRKGPRNSMWKLDLDPRNFRLGGTAHAWESTKKQSRGANL